MIWVTDSLGGWTVEWIMRPQTAIRSVATKRGWLSLSNSISFEMVTGF